LKTKSKFAHFIIGQTLVKHVYS